MQPDRRVVAEVGPLAFLEQQTVGAGDRIRRAQRAMKGEDGVVGDSYRGHP
jgi:hypothetical protein